jgi:uncharacterized membrane protein YfcA
VLISYLPLLGVLVSCGLVAGFAAGLLGVGGGIVTVPVLEYALGFTDVPAEYRMQLALGTSLAAIIPTSISAARLHHARGAVDMTLAKRWGLPMALAAFLGSVLATHAPLAILAGIFGAVSLVVAVKMLLPLDELRVAPDAPQGHLGAATSALIGGTCSIIVLRAADQHSGNHRLSTRAAWRPPSVDHGRLREFRGTGHHRARLDGHRALGRARRPYAESPAAFDRLGVFLLAVAARMIWRAMH